MEKLLQLKTLKYSALCIILFLSLVFMLLWAPKAHGFVFQGDDQVRLTNEIFNDVYVAGRTIDAENIIHGDLAAAGQFINVHNTVTGDIHGAGQFINIKGSVDDDIRLAGQMIRIENIIGSDAIAFGQEITLTKEGKIKGDAAFTGQIIQIDGDIAGNVLIAAEKVIIKGLINMNAEIEAQEIVMDENAKIVGSFIYKSPKEIENIEKHVGGEVTYQEYFPHKKKEEYKKSQKSVLKWIFAFLLFSFLSSLVLALIIGAFTYPFHKKIGIISRENYWKSLGIGWVLIIVGFGASILLLFTVIGTYLSIVIFTLLALMIFLGDIYLALVATSYMLTKRKNVSKTMFLVYLTLILLLVHIISIIPILDVVVWIFGVPASFGVIMLFKLEMKKKLIKS